MTIDLTCQKCEGSFELDVAQLIEGEEKLACPNCSAKAPQDLNDDFTSALAELIAQTENLAKRFSVSLSVETDELPGAEEEDEEEDEDDDEDAESDDEDEDLDADDDDDLDEDDEERELDEDEDR